MPLKPLPAHSELKDVPMMPARRLAELAASIRERGQDDDIMIAKENGIDVVIDGRNREAACLMAGVKPRYKRYKKKDLLDFIMTRNTIRRDLEPEKRASLMANWLAKKKASGEAVPTQKEAAAKAGVSRSTLQRAVKKVSDKGPPSWTQEDLKKDGELMNAFVSIAAIFGNDDTKAIRLGKLNYKRADVIELANMGGGMEEIRELVMRKYWTPKRCKDFLKTMPDENTTLEEMVYYTLSDPGKKLTVEINGFRHTCVPIGKK